MSETEQVEQIRIAVADDEPVVRSTFVRLLELLGHNVVCSASNGAELIDLCSGQEVDVAFVDLDMPVMDGLAAAAEVSKQGIPVVLISGHPDVYDVVVEHEPVVTRLLKPASIDDLRQAIKDALASRR
jgi:response regulator NasT